MLFIVCIYKIKRSVKIDYTSWIFFHQLKQISVRHGSYANYVLQIKLRALIFSEKRYHNFFSSWRRLANVTYFIWFIPEINFVKILIALYCQGIMESNIEE